MAHIKLALLRGIRHRQAGTPEENKTVVQGSTAYFGTYSVSDTDKTFTIHIEGTMFRKWIGTDQKRPFTISGAQSDLLPISGQEVSLAFGGL